VRLAISHIAALLASVVALSASAGEIDFNRDIRPILSDNCFPCHGPDEASRKGGLRLDLREAAIAAREGHPPAIVPHAPENSEALRRILHEDPAERMPPEKSEKQLNPDQVAKLREWIAQGADWPVHWAFVPPKRPAVPEVANPGWVRNPVDAFVLARLEREGLAPSPQADAATLLRRLSLDITGLPPTIAEIDAFTAGDLESAYNAAVERLLHSPHYGERWARSWLDSAQYADSDGFEKDKPREVWAWRDYVINAFNANKPYDAFIVEQIAGDLLPGATQEQRVATGFLRNSLNNEEGGIDPEQFRMEALFNRLDIIGRAVLGLTVNCAQCHTHKYDPITHSDYYRMLAYLNNSYEACMTVYTPEEQSRRTAVHARVAALEETIRQGTPDWRERMAVWEQSVRSTPQPDWKICELSFDDTSSGGQKFLPRGDGSYLAAGYAPTRFHPKMSAGAPLRKITAVRLELLTDRNLPRNGPGRSIYGAGALSEFHLRVGAPDAEFEKFGEWQKVEIASAIADVNTPTRDIDPIFQDRDGNRKAVTGPANYAIDGRDETAWTTDNGPERRNQPRQIIFRLATPLEVPEGHKLGFQLSQVHGGWNSDDNQNNNLGRFRLSVTDAANLPETLIPARVMEIISRGPEGRSQEDKQELFRYWRGTRPDFAVANLEIEQVWSEHPDGATQLVYHEMEQPRVTHRLDRGDFLSPREAVEPGTPDFLHPQRPGAPKNRLGLAQWLIDPASPTTARSFVNRVWQHYFGTGLVATASDLGSQGEAPSHPELLDWLAVEFMESGWDIKALHRLIVNSNTYRQSSHVSPELLDRDPANRLLARASRFRVEGEVVRDITLAASGLLNPAVGGPSVYPPAPAFLFEPPASYGPKIWKTANGTDKYRRGLYVFRYRSVPYPALQAFDTPPGDAPCVQRLRSNTPLQALVTLNEPAFMESAESLAALALAQGGASDEERMAFAFKRCTARTPQPHEQDAMLRFLAKQRERTARGEIDAATLLGDEGTADAELAAWTLAARLLLNLDETITRQ
jgi:hypothetical protein